MFNGRQYRTRLPVGKEQQGRYHEELVQQDAEAKEKMKKNADARKNVKESMISEGDLILIRQKQRNKTVSPFDPRPYVVL